jgi:hypothetical protein
MCICHWVGAFYPLAGFWATVAHATSNKARESALSSLRLLMPLSGCLLEAGIYNSQRQQSLKYT